MSRKPRLTVFSRFLILMLIVGPLAFIGASYYHGEDGIQNIKDFFEQRKERNNEIRSSSAVENAAQINSEQTYEIRKLKEELDYKQKRLEELYRENDDLKLRIKRLEKQLNE